MVAQVRRFNRTVTQRVGALDDRFLARDRSLGEARLLWEIGADGRDVRALRTQLDLDSGYLSRLLRSLEAAGLVTVEPEAVRPAGPDRAADAPRDRQNAGCSTSAATSWPRSPRTAQRGPACPPGRRDGRGRTATDGDDDRGRADRSGASAMRGTACARTSPSSTAGSTPASIPRGAWSPMTRSNDPPPDCSWSRPCTVSRSAAGRCASATTRSPTSSGCGWRVRTWPGRRPAAADPARGRSGRPWRPSDPARDEQDARRSGRPLSIGRLCRGRAPSTKSLTRTTGSKSRSPSADCPVPLRLTFYAACSETAEYGGHLP